MGLFNIEKETPAPRLAPPTITEGDRVDVYFTGHEPILHAEVLYVPQATGDAWHLRVDTGFQPVRLYYVQSYTYMMKVL